MSALPQTPFFYVGVYLLIGVLHTMWGWKGAFAKFHATGRQRFGHLADMMVIAPIVLWPVVLLFDVLRLLHILPTSWKLKIKDRVCKCGGEYRTHRSLVEHSGLIGKLIVKCWKCKEVAELWGDVEIDDPEKKA